LIQRKDGNMAQKKDWLIKILNRLIEANRDGENGYGTGAGAVKNGAVKKLFNTYSAQRARFVVELQAEVERLGGTPAGSGTLAGTLHRGWMHLKCFLSGGTECSIVAECRHGEALALQNYEEALKQRLPAEMRSLLLRQFERVKEANARVHALHEVCARCGHLSSAKAGA
jgi:uncharacterized protein (TIGR02284 family)